MDLDDETHGKRHRKRQEAASTLPHLTVALSLSFPTHLFVSQTHCTMVSPSPSSPPLSNTPQQEHQPAEKWKILGQDVDVLIAVAANLLSWFVSTFTPSLMPYLLPSCPQEAIHDTTATTTTVNPNATKCVSIGRPGGLEQLRLISLCPHLCTKGYNVGGNGSPFLHWDDMPDDCVVLSVRAFSVNYADCCIRWGLYESANRFVGWPIVPGFDVAGVVERVGKGVQETGVLQEGDKVFGCTLFGAYSSRVVVPAIQLRKLSSSLSSLTMPQAAAVPTVSLTALYALLLAGHYPQPSPHRNKSILIHSASGGVGGMLVQMSKLLGLGPIVGVVGRTSKVEEARRLGCDVGIDKSQDGANFWKAAREASPGGYSTIMDSNGVSTLMDSYNHLCSTGRVIVFGFHSNLPMGKDMLSPWQWVQMGLKMSSMPKFEPMDMVVSCKSVLGFNLSFFSEEKELVTKLLDQVCTWLGQGKIQCPRVVEMEMERVAEAHSLIMSGKTVGKLVLTTSNST